MPGPSYKYLNLSAYQELRFSLQRADFPGIIDCIYEKGNLRSDCAKTQSDWSLAFSFMQYGPISSDINQLEARGGNKATSVYILDMFIFLF